MLSNHNQEFDSGDKKKSQTFLCSFSFSVPTSSNGAGQYNDEFLSFIPHLPKKRDGYIPSYFFSTKKKKGGKVCEAVKIEMSRKQKKKERKWRGFLFSSKRYAILSCFFRIHKSPDVFISTVFFYFLVFFFGFTCRRQNGMFRRGFDDWTKTRNWKNV